MTGDPRRILLVHLVSYGDCLYATAIARQIKHDFPECHLTWAISTSCRAVLEGNPHVDSIWEIKDYKSTDSPESWNKIMNAVSERRRSGDFDVAYITQFWPDFFERWNGTIRGTIFAGYPKPISVPLSPVMRLSSTEIENVAQFAKRHNLFPNQNGRPQPVLLFECSPKSGQSFVTPAYALETANLLIRIFPEMRVILSSNIRIDRSLSDNDQIIDGSELSFRENAELTKFCTMLIGCSSGISWLATSDWAKPLPMIQVLNGDILWGNSLLLDHERCNLPVANVLEMYNCSVDKLVRCVECAISSDFQAAKLKFHEPPVSPNATYRFISRTLLYAGQYKKAVILFRTNRKQLVKNPSLFVWQILVLGKSVIRVFLQRLFDRRNSNPLCQP